MHDVWPFNSDVVGYAHVVPCCVNDDNNENDEDDKDDITCQSAIPLLISISRTQRTVISTAHTITTTTRVT